ncbi:unnamed protein product [Owenia fusiformis]|uniref:Uncharacterized protein n=1 Tax=Owenia fusiformis TaxID=6347 RepID=A0A8J1TIN3_OWEFU|nr:unnamed protein product [Owenia fusiformis]
MKTGMIWLCGLVLVIEHRRLCYSMSIVNTLNSLVVESSSESLRDSLFQEIVIVPKQQDPKITHSNPLKHHRRRTEPTYQIYRKICHGRTRKWLELFPNGSHICHPCSKCRPGYGVKEHCALEKDTICEQCTPGSTYSKGLSQHHPCKACDNCLLRQKAKIKECTATENTKCGHCKKGFYRDAYTNLCVNETTDKSNNEVFSNGFDDVTVSSNNTDPNVDENDNMYQIMENFNIWLTIGVLCFLSVMMIGIVCLIKYCLKTDRTSRSIDICSYGALDRHHDVLKRADEKVKIDLCENPNGATKINGRVHNNIQNDTTTKHKKEHESENYQTTELSSNGRNMKVLDFIGRMMKGISKQGRKRWKDRKPSKKKFQITEQHRTAMRNCSCVIVNM